MKRLAERPIEARKYTAQHVKRIRRLEAREHRQNMAVWHRRGTSRGFDRLTWIVHRRWEQAATAGLVRRCALGYEFHPCTL